MYALQKSKKCEDEMKQRFKQEHNDKSHTFSQLDLISSSQPDPKKIRVFTASECVVANDTEALQTAPSLDPPEIPGSSNVTEAVVIPDSLPISAVADSQLNTEDSNWNVRSSFDPNVIDVDDDIDSDVDCNSSVIELGIPTNVKRKANERQVADDMEAAHVITVGKSAEKAANKSSILIKNKKIDKLHVESHDIKEIHEADDLSGKDNCSHPQASSDCKIVPESLPCDNTLNENKQSELNEPVPSYPTTKLSVEQQETYNASIGKIKASPLLHDPRKSPASTVADAYKKILSYSNDRHAANKNEVSGDAKTFKRRLMDTEEKHLFSQESPLSQKVPSFAKRKYSAGLNECNSFILSKSKSKIPRNAIKTFKQQIVEDLVPAPPKRNSILKKKLLNKSKTEVTTQVTTPNIKAFDFDEVSEESWVKTCKKKSRKPGFKSKLQKKNEENEIRRQLKNQEKESKLRKVNMRYQLLCVICIIIGYVHEVANCLKYNIFSRHFKYNLKCDTSCTNMGYD